MTGNAPDLVAIVSAAPESFAYSITYLPWTQCVLATDGLHEWARLAVAVTEGCAGTDGVFTPSLGEEKMLPWDTPQIYEKLHAKVPASVRGIKVQMKHFGTCVHAVTYQRSSRGSLLWHITADMRSLTVVHFIPQTNTVYVSSHNPLQPGHDLSPALIPTLLTQCPEKQMSRTNTIKSKSKTWFLRIVNVEQVGIMLNCFPNLTSWENSVGIHPDVNS